MQQQYMEQMLIDKWETNAKYHFYATLVLYLSMMILVSILIAVLGNTEQEEPNLHRWVLEGSVAFLAVLFFGLFILDTIMSMRQRAKHHSYIEANAKMADQSLRRSLNRSQTVSAKNEYFWRKFFGVNIVDGLWQVVKDTLTRTVELVNLTTVLLNLAYLIFLAIILFRFLKILTGYHSYESDCVELGFASLFGWVYMLFFARGWRQLGHLVVTIAYMLARDVFRFVLIYAVISLAYSQTIFMLAKAGAKVPGMECCTLHPDISDICVLSGGEELSCSDCMVTDNVAMCIRSYAQAWWSLFRYTIGAIEFLNIPSGYQLAIYLSYSIISNILILNLLIALMNNTFEDVSQEADRIWVHQWANYILLAERRPSLFARSEGKRLGSPDVETRYKRALAADILRSDTSDLLSKHRGEYEDFRQILSRPDHYHLIHEVVNTHGTAVEQMELILEEEAADETMGISGTQGGLDAAGGVAKKLAKMATLAQRTRKPKARSRPVSKFYE